MSIFHAVDKENNYALPKAAQITQTTGEPISQDPVPNILANGQDKAITVTNNSPASITISLNPGNKQGGYVDWWLAVYTDYGWFSYVLAQGWQPELKRFVKYPLIALPEIELPNPPIFSGKNYFCFAVDENANNIIDATWWDFVEVNVE